jgi:APA family basic amino acid/polyamine antiporter
VSPETGANNAPASSGMAGEGALRRSLGVRQLAASIVTVTIGGGVFVLPAIAAEALGAAAWLAYLICAVVMALLVACFAEAGSRVDLSGGVYAYVGQAFGPFWGYITGVLLLLVCIMAHAAVAASLPGAIEALIPGSGVSAGVGRAALLIGVFGFFTAINLRGVKQGATTVEIGTAAKLIPLLFIGIVGLFAMQRANLAWPGMPEFGTLARTSMLMMFAFFGLESALAPSGEVRDPARTVPRAIAIGIILVTLIYLSVQLSAQGILGPELAQEKNAPLAAAAEKGFGRSAGLLLLAGTAISMLMHNSGMMLAVPRGVFALARDGYLPSALARVSPSTGVPTNAVLVYALVVATLAVTGSFTSLAILANAGGLLLYGLCVLAVLGLRRKNIRLTQEPFTIPGGALVPWLSIAAILVLLSTIKLEEYTAVASVLATASIVYAIRARAVKAR